MDAVPASAKPTERSLPRWTALWIAAFVGLVVFYAVAWIPLVDWLFSGADTAPTSPAIDRGVALVLGDLFRAVWYVIAMTPPVGVVFFSIIESGETRPPSGSEVPTTAAPSDAPATEQGAGAAAVARKGDRAEASVEFPSGWVVSFCLLLVPALIALFSLAYEGRELMNACVWSDACAAYWNEFSLWD
jgi:hypothetical protein